MVNKSPPITSHHAKVFWGGDNLQIEFIWMFAKEKGSNTKEIRM